MSAENVIKMFPIRQPTLFWMAARSLGVGRLGDVPFSQDTHRFDLNDRVRSLIGCFIPLNANVHTGADSGLIGGVKANLLIKVMKISKGYPP
jgi:hypothetical protein